MQGSSSRPRGRPAKLTRERIVAAALALVDAEGLDALSMPALATELGVGTMTLYGYVESKDDLLDAVVDLAVLAPSAAVPTAPPGPWRDVVRQLMHVVAEALAAHPALVQIRLRRPVLRPEALRFGELTMGVLLAAGLSPERAATAFRLLFTYVFGSAALSPWSRSEEARASAASALATLDAQAFPVLTVHAAPFAHAVGGDLQFDLGLDLILDGIEASLPG